MKTVYVAGFLFDTWKEMVYLIRKKKGPKHIVGKLNGIGGKVEQYETPNEAMVREFQEEAGVTITDWRLFCTLEHSDAIIHFYSSKSIPKIPPHTREEEIIARYNTVGWPGEMNKEDVVLNLLWLIPMALEGETIVANVVNPIHNS